MFGKAPPAFLLRRANPVVKLTARHLDTNGQTQAAHRTKPVRCVAFMRLQAATIGTQICAKRHQFALTATLWEKKSTIIGRRQPVLLPKAAHVAAR